MINRSRARLTDATYIELVRGILATLFLALISGSAFAIVGAAAIVENHDRLLLALWIAGVAAMGWRVAILMIHRRYQEGPLNARRAGQIERRFAWSYLTFAALFGLFMARALALGSADIRLLVVGMVFGHGAGIAAGAIYRPWIGLPAVLFGIVPTILTAFMIEGQKLWGVGALTLLYMGGGMAAMLRRYDTTARRISLEHLVATISGRDEPTGLANQLALSQRFEELASVHRPGISIALHVIHLDGFGTVNERLGYLVGDALLKETAQRLERITPAEDFAARLGGVNFAIVQAGLDHPRQAEVMAGSIHHALSQPFATSGEQVRFKVSIGYALVPQKAARLEDVMQDACDARDRARLAGGGVARFFAVDHADGQDR